MLPVIESIHKVLGIPHSNDPNLLLNLNSHDLKKIIIDTLEQLPNYSCTKESLATKVLKNLKIRIKGSKRRKFEKSVNHIVGILKRQQIVKQYKAKNIRLKINPDYLDNQDTQSYLFKKSKVKSIIGREIDFQKSDIKYEDEYSNIDDEVTINSILKKTMLPELSEQNHNIDESFEYTDGEDDQSLLNTLTKREELSNADNTFKNSYTVIKNIFSKLKERNKYRIKYDLPNLDIQFNISTDIYEIKISPLGLQNSILLRSLIIFYEPAVLNILELFSRDDFIGSLSVETISNQKFYVLRYTINILKYNIEEILFTIDQVINESKKIIEIIDQKL